MESFSNIKFHRNANKFYSSLNNTEKKIIDTAILDILLNKTLNHKIKKLSNQNAFRYKAENYRIIFTKSKDDIFFIQEIATRENSYKK